MYSVNIVEKVEELMKNHQRFVDQFQDSLIRTGQFIRLAASQADPATSVGLLQQIQEIGMLAHIQELKDDFRWMETIVNSPDLKEDVELKVVIEEVAEKYTDLEEEALSQQMEIQELLAALQPPSIVS